MRCIGVSCFVLLALFAGVIEGYRILCLFPFNGRSHFNMFGALCKGLARKGHQIDMISHFPLKTPMANYTDIVDLNGTVKGLVNTFTIEYGKEIDNHVMYYIAKVFGNDICELMGHEKMQKFIKDPRKPKYDIVLTEYFGSPCYIGFGEFLKAPVGIVLSSMEWSHVDEILGNPLNNAFFPGMFLENAVMENFWDRFFNTIHNFVNPRVFFHYTSPQTEIMRKYLDKDLPDVREIEKTVSLALVNSFPTFHGIRPVTPALVQVGGLHVEENEAKLTPELKAWLDEAKDGVVYFTLGSLLNIETLPEKILLDIYESFKKIAPVKILMKCADPKKLPPGLPANVRTQPWLPQLPILRHKNTKVFITHGGLMGSLEALHSGVPLIGIPVFADQNRNINIFVHKKMAAVLDIDNINEKALSTALNEVLNNPIYMKNAKKEAALFKDRPMSAMDTAAYWIEYVIRRGPNSLKSPVVHMTWWQNYLLDVYALLLSCFLGVLAILLFIMKLVVRKLQGTPVTRVPGKKKRN